MSIHKVAIFGASGNFGRPITAALLSDGFDVTAITRSTSSHTFSPEISVIRTDYSLPGLVRALEGHDAAVCVVGPGGIHLQSVMVDAAEKAGVKRFVVDDFGWGRGSRFEGFGDVQGLRQSGWDVADQRARERREKGHGDEGFSWTGISIGNPIDWAVKRFPLMGFDVTKQEAIIYDSGTEEFTGTTLEGIGQSVVGVLTHLEETRNRTVKVMSIRTCQNELMDAFEETTGTKWTVRRDTTTRLLESGLEKKREGKGGWVLELVVSQLFLDGEGRGMVAKVREETDSELLGVREESAGEVVRKALGV